MTSVGIFLRGEEVSNVKAYNFQGRLPNNKKSRISVERRMGKSDERLTLGDQQLGECKAYTLPGQGERTSNKMAIKRRTTVEATGGGCRQTLTGALNCISFP